MEIVAELNNLDSVNAYFSGFMIPVFRKELLP